MLTAHMCEFLAALLQVIAVLGLDGILNSTGNRVVGAQHRALDELDLAGLAAAQATRGTTAGLLPLAPSLGRAGLTAGVWRGCASRILGGSIVGTAGRVDVCLARVARGGAVSGIRLGQAVCGLRADVVAAAVDAVVVVEGARVGTGGIRVQQRAGDLVLIVAAVGVIVGMLAQLSVGMLIAKGGERAGALLSWGRRSLLGGLGTPL